jgi:hypothetical protein
MRALKILVVVMGVLLVLGTAALVFAVANRVNHPPASAKPVAPAEIELPPGARIVATEMSGERLLVRVALPEGGEELMIFSLANGTRLATITLRAKPAAP